jgi:uncharacterized protein YkwD
MRKAYRRAALISALLIFGATLSAAQSPAPGENARAEQEAERLIATRIDEFRARLAPNAPHLSSDPELVRIARVRATALAHGAPFSHQDLEGHFPAIDLVKAQFGPYGFIGENIFMEMRAGRGFDASAFAKIAADDWMASEEHRDNILSPDFDASGVGVTVFGTQAYATQIFRGPPPPAKRERPPRPKGPGAAWTPDGY